MGKRRQFKFKRPERPGIGQIWNLLSWMWINATLLFHCIAKYNGMQNSYIWAEFYGFRPIFSSSVHNKLFTKLPFCFIVKILDTGKFLSEDFFLAATNPQYDKRLSIELRVHYMKNLKDCSLNYEFSTWTLQAQNMLSI